MLKICLFSTYLICFSLLSQNQDFKIKATHKGTGLPSFIEFNAATSNFPNLENAGYWFVNNLPALPSFKLKYSRSFFGQDSFEHARFSQYFGRFPVEYAEVILHQKGNRTYSMNGVFYPKLSIDTAIFIKHNQALTLALALFPNSVFKWELPAEENLLKDITKNNKSSYYPKGTLVIFRTGVTAENANFRLAYKFDIYAEEPHSRKIIYIDAKTGKVLDQTEQICSIDRVGVAHTRFSGVQSITCDSIADDTFILSESGRGKGIKTINARVINVNDSSRNFLDADNIWNNKNSYKDDVAGDVHWGSEKTYDYYMSNFNRNSYDDSGGVILSKVHMYKNYNNAFWGGNTAHYGDGDGVNFLPLTAIDICGHELSHGYTQYSAGLVYRDESGALNESFSDIFGKCIEMYALPADFSWMVGKKIKLPNNPNPLRDMEDPHQLDMPKYYFGTYYYTQNADNGGVHTNSSVQNYWFYLLCEGGYGKREKDSQYFRVNPIGMEKAAKIAYLGLNGYLYPEAQYYDAAIYSIEVTKSLYGENSTEVRQVQNAWFAVGLFDYFTEVSEPVHSNNWNIMPNPSNGYIYLSNPDVIGATRVQVCDITGKSLMNTTILPNESLDVSGFANGVYFISINGQLTLKFIKE